MPFPSDECMQLVAFLEGLGRGEDGVCLVVPSDDNGDLTDGAVVVIDGTRVAGDGLWECLEKLAVRAAAPELIELFRAGRQRRLAGARAEQAAKGRFD